MKQEWQDIATAPRDGKEILVGWYEDELYVGHDRPEVPEKVWKDCVAYWDSHRKLWLLSEPGYFAEDNTVSSEPTHWHPRLAPPVL